MLPGSALRRIKASHKQWEPHAYQRKAIEHLCTRGSAALFLDPGLGKTSVALAAFCALQDEGIARTALVIAPMRVCQLVWRQEAKKWTQFGHLKFAMLAGKSAEERSRLLRADADIWLINPESVPWLCDQFKGTRLPFDTGIVDELTKFKNSRALRSKQLQPLFDKMPRRWGLTGTPVPNGYMDLFGQMRLIDGGAALGKYITHFRDRFFQMGRDGFSYDLRPEAGKQIEKAVEPYVFRADADDYLTLPPLQTRRIELELPKPVRAKYKEMKRDMIVAIEGKTITAANMAAVYNKLQQFVGGAMYTSPPDYVRTHDLKLDALDDLIEELAGQPLLVAYAYGHELARILERHPNTPFLGGGVSGKRAEEIEQQWNAGKIPVLLCHPASAGHGLNMQLGGAGHLCWFSQTWDYELYDQFIRRVHRQGNAAERIVMHKIMVLDTMDELVEDALSGKETTQDALLAALKSEIIRDDPSALSAFNTNVGANMRKLSSPGAPQAAAQPAFQQTAQVLAQGLAQGPAQSGGVKGWGSAAPVAQAATPEAPTTAPAARGWGSTAFAAAQPVHETVEQPAATNEAPQEAPFDGGQPVLADAPPKAEKAARAPRARSTASEPLIAASPAVYINKNVVYEFNVAEILKVLVDVTSVEQALEAIAALADHLDGKE